MIDINTVTLSGILADDVEISKAKDLSVARFYIDVEGAGEQKSCGNFKAVAFDKLAEVITGLSKGDRVVLLGALVNRKGRGRQEIEIRLRNLIPLTRIEPDIDLKVTKLDDEDSTDDEDCTQEEEEGIDIE